jgi:aspartyl-tRNA(Asn)/glutamyl-tRNA(Gln) amidotransferase subunit A
MFDYIRGHDPKDSTSLPDDFPKKNKSRKTKTENIRIGIVKEFLGEGTDNVIINSVWDAVNLFEKMGYTYEETSLPHIDYSIPAYYIIAMSEASSNLARYDGVRYGYRTSISSDWNEVFSKTRAEGFGQEVIRRLMLGTFALTAGYFDQYYLKALRVRKLIQDDFKRSFKKYDILVGPTSPILPFGIGEKISDPIEMYRLDIDTVPINLAGIPAISLPCSMSQGLPIGIQLMADFMDDKNLLNVAGNLERELNLKISPVL